jgi:hypothetical protein
MLTPYIGITDFMSFSQVERMLEVFKWFRPKGVDLRLHVGVMMSYKTLNRIETKWSKVFPPNESVAGIFSSDEVMNCLHYADYTEDPVLWENLVKAIEYGGIGINALQLDMTWPEPAQIAQAVHSSRKQLEIILQIGQEAFKEIDEQPEKLVERLREYQGVIHHVLLDKSMGRGLGMNAVGLLPFARAIKQTFPNLGIGAVGGLGPDTLDLVKPLIAEFPHLNTDAEGKLRPSGSVMDPIDWVLAETYLIRNLKLKR